jgi:hypothetical protein
MAREVAGRIESHGFRTLKIKTGQGLNTDRQTLREVRSGPVTAFACMPTATAPRRRRYRTRRPR